MSNVISILLGAALSAIFGIAAFWWQRRYEGRQQFLAITASIRADLDVSPCRAGSIYMDSIPKLAHAIHVCRPHVSAECFTRLQSTWQEYRKHSQSSMNPQCEEGISYQFSRKMPAAEFISKQLDMFDECIRHPVV